MSEVTMTQPEREEFLAGLHVGVISIDQAGRPPLTIPVWYDYQPGGEVTILTSTTSTKGRLLEVARGFSLCAQTETRPYSYVSVEGAVTGIRPADQEADTRPLARRYLGTTAGDDYTDNTPQGPDLMVYSMRPERWYTVDYSKLNLPGLAAAAGSLV